MSPPLAIRTFNSSRRFMLLKHALIFFWQNMLRTSKDYFGDYCSISWLYLDSVTQMFERFFTYLPNCLWTHLNRGLQDYAMCFLQLRIKILWNTVNYFSCSSNIHGFVVQWHPNIFNLVVCAQLSDIHECTLVENYENHLQELFYMTVYSLLTYQCTKHGPLCWDVRA